MALLPFHWGNVVISLFFTWCLGRFVPCSKGANHCWPRHIGWERCGHLLTSRPRESASEPFLNELLGLFGYPTGSARALHAGTLPLRYCTTRFARRIPTWRLPVPGQVACLVTAHHEASGANRDEVSRREVHWVSGSCPRRKRIRLNRKNPCTPRCFGDSMSSTGVEEIVSSGAFGSFYA